MRTSDSGPGFDKHATGDGRFQPKRLRGGPPLGMSRSQPRIALPGAGTSCRPTSRPSSTYSPHPQGFLDSSHRCPMHADTGATPEGEHPAAVSNPTDERKP